MPNRRKDLMDIRELLVHMRTGYGPLQYEFQGGGYVSHKPGKTTGPEREYILISVTISPVVLTPQYIR